MRPPSMRLLRTFVGTGLMILLVLACSIELGQWALRRQAEQLLHDVTSLRVGKSRWPDLQAFMLRWQHQGSIQGSSCTAAKCNFQVELDDRLGSILFTGPDGNAELRETIANALQMLHWHAASAGAVVQLRGDQVVFAEVMVMTGVRPNMVAPSSTHAGEYELIGEVKLTPDVPFYTPWPYMDYHPEYRATRPTGCLGCVAIQMEFHPDVTSRELAQYATFNFDCITGWRVCTSRADIMPVAWADYIKLYPQAAGGEDRLDHCQISVQQLTQTSSTILTVQIVGEQTATRDADGRSYPAYPAKLLSIVKGDYPWARYEQKIVWAEWLDRKSPLRVQRDAVLLLFQPTNLPDLPAITPSPCGTLAATDANLAEVNAAMRRLPAPLPSSQ